MHADSTRAEVCEGLRGHGKTHLAISLAYRAMQNGSTRSS